MNRELLEKRDAKLKNKIFTINRTKFLQKLYNGKKKKKKKKGEGKKDRYDIFQIYFYFSIPKF